MTSRHDKVNDLVDAALVGMEQVPDFSASEFVSAAFTLTLRALQATLKSHPEQRGQIKEAVSVLLMECADPRLN